MDGNILLSGRSYSLQSPEKEKLRVKMRRLLSNHLEYLIDYRDNWFSINLDLSVPAVSLTVTVAPVKCWKKSSNKASGQHWPGKVQS